MTDPKLRVVFICTGNICRSPMAEAVTRDRLRNAGVAKQFSIRSAGLGEWHVGERADARAISALQRKGFDGTDHRARLFDKDDFDRYDLVVAMDNGHRDVLLTYAPTPADREKIVLMRDFDPSNAGKNRSIVDPYYADDDAFDQVLQNILDSVDGLVTYLLERAVRVSQGQRDATEPALE